MRHAPIAMNTVSTTGNSSGSIDMPSAMPASNASSQEPPRKSPYRTTASTLREPADQRKDADQPLRLRPQPRRLALERAQRLTDLADLAARASRGHFGKARAPHDQRSRRRHAEDRRRRAAPERPQLQRAAPLCAPARTRPSGAIHRPADRGSARARRQPERGRLPQAR